METAVVVGRFQVNTLHQGHLALLDIANNCAQLIIVVGVHPIANSIDHPLDFKSRCAMLSNDYPDAVIAPLPDAPSDAIWSQRLDTLMAIYAIHERITLYAGRDSFSAHYTGQYKVQHIDEVGHESGRQRRQAIRQTVTNSDDFRRGVIYANQSRWARFHLTVDVALLSERHGECSVLLGQKKSLPHHWRFAGGFVDQTDASSEDAAKRELHEETGCVDSYNMQLMGNFKVKDWRQTNGHHFMTSFYVAWTHEQALQSNDDLSFVAWHKLKDIQGLQFADDHAMLGNQLLRYLNKNFQHQHRLKCA